MENPITQIQARRRRSERENDAGRSMYIPMRLAKFSVKRSVANKLSIRHGISRAESMKER